MKSIYTTYKERLVEISGKSRSIFSKKGDTRFSCDLSKFLEDVYVLDNFIDMIWKGKGNSFGIIGEETKESLFYSSGIDDIVRNSSTYKTLIKNNPADAKKIVNELRSKEYKKVLNNNVNAFYKLRKEIIDIAKETGRYELYVGYPFVEGTIVDDLNVKGPLILFPVKVNIIDDAHVNIEVADDMPVTLNKALLLAYAKEKRLNIDDMVMEFGNDFDKTFKNVGEVINYLKKYHIDINYDKKCLEEVTPFDSTDLPQRGDPLRITNHCVVGRFPLANSIYLDYTELENQKAATNSAIDELLYTKEPVIKNKKKVHELYTINKLDYTQEKAIERINNEGNMVIYGPPGTGKSQTIVNVISDALARKKRVLIVSQKKAALDVVYSRLGNIREKAMFIVDPEKEKEAFYKRVYDAHSSIERHDCSGDFNKHAEYQEKINQGYDELKNIFDVLYQPTDFGVCLEKMYEESSEISKNSFDYEIYEALNKRNDILKLKYDSLNDCLERIKLNNRHSLYYKYENLKKKNPISDHMKSNLDVYNLDLALNKLDKILVNKSLGYDISKYPYAPYLLAHYLDNINGNYNDVDRLVSFIAKQNKKKGFLMPSKFEKELKETFLKALDDIKWEVNGYSFLKDVLDEKGYQLAVAAILNGNMNMLRNLRSSLNSYTEIKEIKLELTNLTDMDREILDLAYKSSDTHVKYNQFIDKLMPIRMYIEIVKEEQNREDDLAKIMNFPSIKENILRLKKKQEGLARNIAKNSFNDQYIENYENHKDSKSFLYQISKQQHSWPIRKFIKEYKDLIMDLYPCWLLSPENASNILPLVKDMFDIVLVDEASQVFIENTLPLIYRGKNIVVAGDNKQLRPTSTFLRRYMGADIDEIDDPTTEANLEAVSLLDLATPRLPSTNLNYHYRSRSQELIDFSNSHFYDGKLEIVPDLVGDNKKHAITRIKVNGKWINRKNEEEARTTVLLLKKILLNRTNNESIGIISFNSDQASAIEEAIRLECKADPKFAEAILKEQNRYEGSEDFSLFVKNLENVQGDERDVIILSTGYAPNENGKVLANFGSLSLEGGENRLNVAVTRAKKQAFVVTSIEPEDLIVENTKNEGPKLFKKYLQYVRAVSNGRKEELKVCLRKKDDVEDVPNSTHVSVEIKKALEKLGYHVDVNVGNTKKKIDLAIYDKETDRYLLGIDCINKNYKSMDDMIESRVYHDGFLESRGWKIHHVWTRDWWSSKTKVINAIVREIENAKMGTAPQEKKVLANNRRG